MLSTTFKTMGFAPVLEPASAAASKAKLLFVVGESADSVQSMGAALAAGSFNVKALAASEVSVEMLEQARPSLILLDPQALDGDGTALARSLLLDERLIDIPIVALMLNRSPENSPSEEYGCFDGYITKLAQGASLASQIQDLLDNPKLDNGKDPSSTELAAVKRRALEEGAPRGFPYIIKRAEQLAGARTVRARHQFAAAIRFGLELLNRDPDTNAEIGSLRVSYLRRRRTELEHLRAAVATQDWDAFATAGHNMKGTGAGYGFGELTDLGRHLESSAKGHDLLAVEGLLQRIEEYIALVQPSLGTA